MPTAASGDVEAFIARRDGTERAERANKDMFLTELCAVLGVEPPEPARGGLAIRAFSGGVGERRKRGWGTTKLYDRTKERLTQDEVEWIRLLPIVSRYRQRPGQRRTEWP
jgi:hypothetical protein